MAQKKRPARRDTAREERNEPQAETSQRRDAAVAQNTTPMMVEIWKQTVAVQMHFNDLEMRIRNYAITVMGALLAATAIAIEQELFFSFFGWTVSGAALLLSAAAVSTVNFYIMDALWYQRLLAGASKEALRQEAELRSQGLSLELTSSLKRESPIPLRWKGIGWRNRTLRSKHKLAIFYGLLLTIVLIALLNVLVTVRP
jgi:uncharacterized membrane protein